nr:flocculation protein FLO11-like isoform X2 [Nomia melanderi]
MWDLGNRSVVALVSVLSGCVFLYNVWGPILILTILLFLTIYACYSLITNDSLLSPHASFLFDYCVRVFLEVRAKFESIVDHVYRYSRIFWETANRRFFEVFLTKIRMERRRGPHYQLSTDPYPTRRNSSKFDSIAQLSPISRNARESNANELTSENKVYRNPNHSLYARGAFSKVTSTPLLSRSKEEFENESSSQGTSQRMTPVYSHHRSLTRGEDVTYYSSEGSPWGTTISPKAHPTASESKSPLSQSRPLSVSTRYNIDPRVYNDVTSPGLSSRLTKYAAEANNRLTRQSQYHVGQFPKVNLQGSPVPVINPKCVKTRTPVTVRVAPPDAVRYSPPGKQKMLSNLCDVDESLSSSSVPYGLREMSLKRHASREDVTFDLAKKQRIGGVTVNEVETQDETKQKRSRDESSKSEEDISPQNKSARPAKRTKTPSCYDILNSFSSSKNVVSGIKRKARDLSRSGTPDFEKHFKSLESVPNSSVQALSEAQIKNVTYRDHGATEKKQLNARNSLDPVQGKLSPVKGILKTSSKALEMDSHDREVHANLDNRHNGETRTAGAPVFVDTESSRLTNKLFMRAEPERNEKLRMLVEEQGNIRAKFTTDDVEEIKKEDIADMRQTSMKARLQSMFDAISGKATSKINPDVVIQAEEVNTVKSVPCPSSCATLNSSTTTTNANTTPISTSAVSPSPGSKSTKHVTFDLTSKESSLDSKLSSSNSKPMLATSAGNSFVATSGNAIFPSPVTNVSSAVSSSELKNAAPAKTINVTSSATPFASVADPSSHRVASTSSTPSVVTAATPAVLSGNSFGATTGVTFNSPTISASSSSFATKTNMTPVGQLNQPHTTEKASSASSMTPTNNNTAFSSPMLRSVTWSAESPAGQLNQPHTTEKASSTSSMTSTNNNTAFSSPMLRSVAWSVATTNAVESKGQSTLVASAPTTATSSVPTTAMLSTSPFTFGNKPTTAQPLKPEASFVFGSNFGENSAQTSGGLANLTAKSQAAPVLNANQGATGLNLMANTPATTSAFNTNVKTTATPFKAPAISTFSFGAGTSVAPNKTAFSFGGIATTTVATPAPTTAATTTATTAAAIGSMFGTTQSQPVFGASSTSNATNSGGNTSAVTLFNPTPTVIVTSVSSTPIFSNTVPGSSSGMTSTNNTTSIFGSVANAPSSREAGIGKAPSTNIFSNASSASAFGATGNIFGQAKAQTGNMKGIAGTFMSNAPPLFGTPATTVATFNSPSTSSNTVTPIFGSAIVSTNATTSVFAATSVTSPAFGSQSSTILGGQSNASQAFGGRTCIFGTDPSASASASTSTSAAPVFGASVSTSAPTPLFGAPVSTSAPIPASTVSSTFTGQGVTSPAFGAPVNASGPVLAPTGAFGDSKAPSFGQASPFATSNATPTVFGSGSASNTNSTTNATSTSGIFTFGANQKPSQQAGAFSFNSNVNANTNTAAPSASTPFQFGATASKPAATGFNFSAPSTTPSINFGTTSAPTFNASMPGMFSIGSGSAAPRSRSVRTRKPR